MNTQDDFYMELAIRMSRRGLGRCAPNPSVGAVIVQYDSIPTIVARGWTQPSGRPHAEAMALNIAGDRSKGATLYVTLEPCSHFGKTPPCADHIIKAGISKVVYAVLDPDKRVAGRGIAKLKDAGIEVRQAANNLCMEAEWVLKGHILRQIQQRPFVQVKTAVDADYMVSRGDGAPVWVTGPLARAYGHLMRAQADAILVGRGTAEADDPELTCRLPGVYSQSPVRVLLDKSLKTSIRSKLFKAADQVPLWVFCSKSNAQKVQVYKDAGAQIIHNPLDAMTNHLSIEHVLSQLADRGITRLMVEGGPGVIQSFWKAECIDEFVVFQSISKLKDKGIPVIDKIGLESVLNSGHYQLFHKRKLGDDVMKTYRFKVE